MATRDNRKPDRKPSTTKRMIIMLLSIGLLLFLLVGWNVMGQVMMKKAMANMPVPPQTVTSTTVGFDQWQPMQAAVSTLRAVRGADLAFDASGVISKIEVGSGDEVEKGQLLAELRSEDDLAALRQAEAAAELAKVTFERAHKQLEVKAIPRATYDNAQADLKAKRAAVQQAQAMLGKKQLRAPFAGRIGIVTLSPGAYLNAGTPVVTLQQLDPIHADFFVPQRDLGQIRVGQRVVLRLDAYADREFEGLISAIAPKVDGDTRNARVEASLPNEDGVLMPGMFANVAIEVGEQKRQLTLPQTAITFNPYGETVYVVKPGEGTGADGKPALPTAQQVFVTTGPTRGDQVAVLSGLEEGTEVVTSGQLKLKNGTPLVIDNARVPKSDADPKPQES
ncbi:MAG TPA: efflux RND transporter periplasmic adaptor subunit [Dokdonella sp.]